MRNERTFLDDLKPDAKDPMDVERDGVTAVAFGQSAVVGVPAIGHERGRM